MSPQVLIVDDEPQLLRALRITLRAFSYEVHTAATGADALACAARYRLDLVILDLGLPDLEGTAVIRALRGWTSVPIIVLSGRTDPAAKTQALDLGADDYVTKPFSMAELNARIRAALRRGTPEPEPATPRSHRIGEWLIDLGAHTIAHSPGAAPHEGAAPAAPGAAPGNDAAADEPTAPPPKPHLTPTEWKLLEILLANPGKLVDSRHLLSQVWGIGYEHSTNYLRVYLWQLRAKLEPVPSDPRHLITEPGMGYRYEP
jgi:two-component system, OmpR family, KDP operon response regulator KdpE